MKKFTSMLVAAATLMGCAAPLLKFPGESPVSVTVLSGAGASELGAGDHLIADSQVFVGGRTTGDTVVTYMGGGMIPWAIGSAVNAALNASDLGDAATNLTMRFNGIVVEALKTQPATLSAAGPAIHISRANDPAALIALEPFARFLVVEKPNARLVFVLNASFDVPGVRGKNSRIAYVHSGGAARPFRDAQQQGWADQGGATFRAAAQRAFVRMTDVFKADLRGELKRASGSLKSVRWQAPGVTDLQSGLLVYEQPDYVALIPIARGGEPVRNSTLIIDRSQLREG